MPDGKAFELILLLAQAVIGLAMFSVRSEISKVKEVVTIRVDEHDRRLNRLEDRER